jgi:hypothetical protein
LGRWAVRDRLANRALGVGIFLFVTLLIVKISPVSSQLKLVVVTTLVVCGLGMLFGYWVLMNLRNNPEMYNWMDPDLKLTRLKEKEKSKENYYAYDPEEREAIVNDYRESRARREIKNKNAWSQSKYYISSATLRKYEREFPKKKK